MKSSHSPLPSALRRLSSVLLGAAALAVAAALPAHAADATTASVKFSDPSKPGTVKINVAHGEIKVRGAETSEVSVTSSVEPRDQRPSQRNDGLRVISSSASFALSEKDNVVTLDYGRDRWAGANADFEVVVPASANVKINSSYGGEIEVAHIDGDVEVKNMNGEVTLKELGGGALVETMNGEVEASFARLPAGKPLSFASMNGEVQLRIPADAKANVRFRTQNGAILTDFDEAALVTKTEPANVDLHTTHEAARIAGEVAREMAQVAREVAEEVRVAVETEMGNGDRREAAKAPRPPRPPRAPSIPAMAGGKVVSGTLNGGGADIVITTMNGDIVVRKN
ncbi:MAG TPA: DUF4097 family beta strand repeat-containing protein [Opitutaceae bacterium]